ncbi:Uncharacterised protein [Chryseobacterium carnipullorum]|uniref:Uncharacterized protein n=1 Tax=Chryseobacterium carnipullorum TaxID=1124835 RepID=A0A376DTU8_CHRCU|nr:Uncharacterised protein [Chryseobacterium carnipullorum]
MNVVEDPLEATILRVFLIKISKKMNLNKQKN